MMLEQTTPPAVERRHPERLPVEHQYAQRTANCRCLSGLTEITCPAQVQNISTGGLSLVLRRRFEPGTILSVELVNETLQGEQTVLVRVLHAHGGELGDWIFGGSFLNKLSEDDLQGPVV